MDDQGHPRRPGDDPRVGVAPTGRLDTARKRSPLVCQRALDRSAATSPRSSSAADDKAAAALALGQMLELKRVTPPYALDTVAVISTLVCSPAASVDSAGTTDRQGPSHLLQRSGSVPGWCRRQHRSAKHRSRPTESHRPRAQCDVVGLTRRISRVDGRALTLLLRPRPPVAVQSGRRALVGVVGDHSASTVVRWQTGAWRPVIRATGASTRNRAC